MATNSTTDTTDPASSLTSMVYDSLRSRRFPLEFNYAVPRQSLSGTGASFDRHRDIAVALAFKFQNTPVIVCSPHRRRHFGQLAQAMFGRLKGRPIDLLKQNVMLLSGAETFEHMILEPGYYVKNADMEIVRQHAPRIADVFDGAHVVELGVGDGEKTAKLIREIGMHKKRAASYVLNDIIPRNIKTASQNLIAAGVGRGHITHMPGDFFAEGLWRNALWDKLTKSSSRTVILMQGATWNNFSYKKMDRLLKIFQKNFKQETSVLLSIDSTANPDTLRRAYVNPHSREFCFRGFTDALDTIGVHTDPRNTSADISIYNQHPDHATVRLGPIRCEPFTIRPNAHLPNGFVHDGRKPFYFEEIHKIRESKLHNVFETAGIHVADVHPFTDVYGMYKNVQQAWWHLKTSKPQL